MNHNFPQFSTIFNSLLRRGQTGKYYIYKEEKYALLLYRLTNRHGNRTRCQITRKIVHRDSRSCISIKMRMNRSRNLVSFVFQKNRVRNISSYRPIIAIGWIFQRYKDCIFFLRTSINCIGEVSIAILCIEKVDSVVGILFIIPPFRFEEKERGV